MIRLDTVHTVLDMAWPKHELNSEHSFCDAVRFLRAFGLSDLCISSFSFFLYQQTSRPVPVLYTLNTHFQISNNKKIFGSPIAGKAGISDKDMDFQVLSHFRHGFV